MNTDMLNKPLQIGDHVFVTRKNYRDLVVARVIKFTPKQVRVVYKASWTSELRGETYLTGEVIKIEEKDLVNISATTRQNLQTLFNQEMGAEAA